MGAALTILFFLTSVQGGTGSIIFLLVPRNTRAGDAEQYLSIQIDGFSLVHWEMTEHGKLNISMLMLNI